MAEKFFISDTHFFHNNVLRFDNRPFKTIDIMHEEMKRKWNNKVTNADTVYICGDFTWRSMDEAMDFLSSLNGRKRLINGNHDFRNSSVKYKKLFESIKDYEEIKVGNTFVQLSHYFIPFYNKHRYGGILLHGHSHNTQEHIHELEIEWFLKCQGFDPKIYNIGCMHSYMNYEPQTLEHIIQFGNAYKKTWLCTKTTEERINR